MPSYLKGAGATRSTPQSMPIPGREAEMAPNDAGGVTFTLSPVDQLRRFLILGSEGGTYYASERKLTADNVTAVRAAIDQEGTAAVELIAQVSESGRAPKNDPALFALAMAAGHPSDDVRRAALAALPRVARTGTHLFHFLDFVGEFRGWGRALKRAVGDWYGNQDVEKVAYQAIKYRQRDGWSHRDALRLAKPRGDDLAPEHNALLGWIVGKRDGYAEGGVGDVIPAIAAFEAAQRADTPQATAALIREFGGLLPREALKTEHLTDKGVNIALVEQGMPMTALIRNLANLTRYGVIEPMSSLTTLICEQITDTDRLRKARVHPIQVLSALVTYQGGVSMRGDGTWWTPVARVVDALDEAFYASFGLVEPTGKRLMLALDVSSSMNWGTVAGVTGVKPSMAAAVMAMVSARSGDPHMIVGFGGHLESLNISPRQRLDDVLRTMSRINFGSTDCSLPMVHATENRLEIDAFGVYTDGETWAGGIHPSQALQRYRQVMGIHACSYVVALTSTGFSIADPRDPKMLDVVGFDTSAPTVISDFVAGRL